MSISLGKLTALPKEREVGGEVYTFSPLTLGDFAALQEWFKEQPLEELQANLVRFGDIYDEEQKREMRREARQEYERRRDVLNRMELDESVIEDVKAKLDRTAQTVEFCARIAYRMLVKNHPDITIDKCRELIDVHTLAMFQELLDDLSSPAVNQDVDLMDDGEEKKTALG